MDSLFKKTYFQFGLLMTGLLLVCLTYLELTGNNKSFENKHPVFFIYQFVAPAVVWYLGMRARKNAQGGKLTYKQGFIEGFKISLVFAFTSPLLFGAYYLLVNPEILGYVKTAYGMTDASNGMIIAIDLLAQIVAAIIFGSIYAAIIAFFARSKSSK